MEQATAKAAQKATQTQSNGIESKPNISQSVADEAVHQNIGQLKVNVEKLDFAVTRRIRAYLKKLIEMGGSDLHVKAGSQIRARICAKQRIRYDLHL